MVIQWFVNFCRKKQQLEFLGSFKLSEYLQKYSDKMNKNGTRGRTRTGTSLRTRDFESLMSTNFITLALERVA